MYWRTELREVKDGGSFYFSMTQFDARGDFNDLDEPWATHGLTFPTPEVAREFAAKVGLNYLDLTDYRTEGQPFVEVKNA